MGCVNGKRRTIKTNAEDLAQPINAGLINGGNNTNSNDSNRHASLSNSKQTESRKNGKKDQQNKRKRKKKKDSSTVEEGVGANTEGSSNLSPCSSTNIGAQRRTVQNGSLLSRYSNSANNEDSFDGNNEKNGSNSFQNYFNVASDRLHKNFQDRLVGTQTSRNGQKLSDSQLEFFKMLDDKIAQGDDPDDS